MTPLKIALIAGGVVLVGGAAGYALHRRFSRSPPSLGTPPSFVGPETSPPAPWWSTVQPAYLSLDAVDDALDDGHSLGEVLSEGGVEIVRVDGFSCAKAKDQVIPDVGAMVPAPLAAVGGPIGQAILTGTGIVRDIFQAIGPKKVCTVKGGEHRSLAVVQRNGGAPDFWVGIGVSFEGREEAAWWVFRGARSASGVLPLQGGYPIAYQTGPKNSYLRVGNKPPGDLWPHVNIPRWRRSVPEALDQPFAAVVREGNDLTLGVWVPPRAPLSHVNIWGKRKIDAPVIWTIEWRIHAP